MNKDENFKLRRQDFHWVVFGIAAGALFLVAGAAYAVWHLIDGNWTNWQIPAIIGICYIVVVSLAAMFLALKTIKRELVLKEQKEQENSEVKTKQNTDKKGK